MQAIFRQKPVSVQSAASPIERLRSRLPSPFVNKIRTTPDFYVEADDPHKRYTAGDLVTGNIIVKVVKPVRITHVVLCLHGYVQVYKNQGVPPADGFRASNGMFGRDSSSKNHGFSGNGFATLFQEETVVCGDGRLDAGRYKFRFSIKFPDTSLPSSIEFERGTVAYMLTATMTRPTTIAPITYHDQKILYREHIDIARYLPPKPRTITLEPLQRRTSLVRSRRSRRSDHESELPTGASGASTPTTDSHEGRNSPSTQSAHSQSMSLAQSATGSNSRRTISTDNKGSITATVESVKGGCLPGEELPIKINIKHNKYIKSMQGVFVTIYRLARVDALPVLPSTGAASLDGTGSGKTKAQDDLYPKSMTGLGGLSLSGAGSCHVFRKDMAQVVVPLLVDPMTLTADVSAKIRMPEDAFATINGVPAGMIMFKYYIEVIIDIQGKVASQDRLSHTMSAGLTDGHHKEIGLDGSTGASHRHDQAHGHSITDTAWIRREKSVIACTLEVVVGTDDSERRRAAGKAIATDTASAAATQDAVSRLSPGTNQESQSFTSVNEYDPAWNTTDPHFEHSDASYHEHVDDADLYAPSPAHFDEDLSEKERLQRAEAALLPSHAPDDDDDMAGPTSPAYATAPRLEDLGYADQDDHYDAYLAHPVGTAIDVSRSEETSELPRYARRPDEREDVRDV